MPKSKGVAEGEEHGHDVSAEAAATHSEPVAAVEPAGGEDAAREAVAMAATVAVVGVGALVFEAALLPGIALGVAAVLAPKYLPRMGSSLTPLLRSTVRSAYKVGQKAKEVAAEAQEHMSDILAEVEAEGEAKAAKVAEAAA